MTIAAAALALLTTMAGGAIWLMQPPDSEAGPVEVYLNDIKLTIPMAYFRFEHARMGGRQVEVDLAANAKSFRPATLQGKYRPEGPDPIEQTIFLTLMPATGKISPAERTTRLYARFLRPGNWSHPGGLIMRRFEDDSPFKKEDIYMTPPEGRLFAARCPRPRRPPDGLPDICQAELRFDGVDVRMRFSANRLADWEHLYQSTRGLIQSFRR